ncbi:hypothetical protein Sa4125_12730 [Aureimonas sp. SA4125]|uniref:hypothetical protein n=1 Tax=Aureimonas sp. SA4125 TaxID=2826993 RepID=UPI001CC3FB4E|nr:hypothetical protein [Aureimonas sp. SA4125]BDA83731.1 hypothetical protein Sa4125_12730 [Aureimonas sp. SA4125]
MKFKNGDEFTAAGKAVLASAMVLCLGLGLGTMVMMAPPSEIEIARAGHQAMEKERELERQQILAREMGRRLNGG